jgi:DNA-binding transcriptional LysR family regulator
MNILNTDLNLLAYLWLLLEEKNVSGAAHKACITQSAMSNALSRLRDLFNDPLLYRVGNTMVLTRKAEELRPILTSLMATINTQILNPSPFNPTSDPLNIRLSCHGYEQLFIVRPLLTFFNTFPLITIENQPLYSQASVEENLLNGSIDYATSPYNYTSKSLHRSVLIHDHFVCITLLKLNRLTVDSYASLNHFLISPYGDQSSIIDALNKARNITFNLTEFSMIPDFLNYPNSIATVPYRLAKHFKTYLPINCLDLPIEKTSFSIYLYWSDRVHETNEHQFFMSALNESIALSKVSEI